MLVVNLCDGYIEVVGDKLVPPGLKEELSYWQRVSVLEGYKRTMKNVKRECFTMSTRIEEDGSHEIMVTMPGLAGRIKKYLENFRIKYIMTDKRTPFPKPDIRGAMAGMRPSQVECVYTALMSEGGIISAATGFGKSYIIASIIKAYDPELLRARGTPTCLVTVKDQEICLQNYEKLKELFPDREVGVLCSSKTRHSDDILSVTLDSLHRANMDEVGIMLVDEVHEAATASRSDKLAKAVNARRWGFSATATGRFDNSDLVTEGLVGPQIYSYSYQDGVRDGVLVPIEVLWLNVPPPTTIDLPYYLNLKQRLAKYRHGVEHNAGQKALINEILDRIDEDEEQILCIMQHTEQMNALVEGRKDVTCVHAVTDSSKLSSRGLTNLSAVSKKDRKKAYEGMKTGEIRKAMSTYVYKQGVDFPGLSVLIQAGGGGSKIASAQIPGRCSRLSDGKDRAYLVDFWHPWDQKVTDEGKLRDGPILRDDKARRRIYKKLGFTQSPVDDINSLPFIA